ncbi:MAG: hypothetical protein ACF8QF_09855 [Phycisphaerales bacterium]
MNNAGADLERLAASAAAGLDALPWGAHALAAAALIAGLIMWLSGRKFVRPLYALLFALGGAAIGFAGPSAVGLHADPYLGLGIGLLVGFLVSAIVYRFTMALTLAGVAAVVAPMFVAAAINISQARAASDGFPDPDAMVADLLGDMSEDDSIFATNEPPITIADDARRSENSEEASVLDGLEIAAIEASLRIRRVALALWSDAIDRFDAMPPLHRLLMLLALLGGAGAGFALGFSFPGKVAAIATAFVGAAVWLGGASWMATLLSVPPTRVGLATPLSWLLVWLAVSIAGTLIQWTALRPRADESR